MKNTLLHAASVAIMSAAALGAAAQDNIVMTIGGQQITRSEFEYSYQKNNGPEVIDRKSVADYVPLFINYKRKVLAALDAKLDTLSSFRAEYRQYRDMLVQPTLINDADVEQQARKIYDDTKRRIGPDGLANPQHILIRVSQNASEDDMQAAKLRADSIYNALSKGADFATLAQQLSQDPGSAQRGGDIGFIERKQTLPAFDEAAFALKEGELSKPVLSEVGYHIIKMKQRKQLDPYDSLRSNIMLYIEKRKLRDAMAQNRLKELSEQTSVSQEQYMDQRADSLAALDPKQKYLMQEYHDGLLLFEISNRQVWQAASEDEAALQAYYKKHRKEYRWDAPRFKGTTLYAKDPADVKAVEKALKGKPFAEWTTIMQTFNNDSIMRIQAEKGLFKQGDNGVVDREIFKVANAKIKERKGYDITTVIGKTLKAPEEMEDVRQLVINDYQETLEQKWLKELEARYPATVDEAAIATIANVK